MRTALDFEADLARVPVEARWALSGDYARRRKSAPWAYVWWAVLGAHYAYLGKRREQVWFVVTLGGLGIWWAVDAVRIPRLVEDANATVRAQLVARYATFATGPALRPPGSVRGPAALPPVVPQPGGTVPAAGRARSA